MKNVFYRAYIRRNGVRWQSRDGHATVCIYYREACSRVIHVTDKAASHRKPAKLPVDCAGVGTAAAFERLARVTILAIIDINNPDSSRSAPKLPPEFIESTPVRSQSFQAVIPISVFYLRGEYLWSTIDFLVLSCAIWFRSILLVDLDEISSGCKRILTIFHPDRNHVAGISHIEWTLEFKNIRRGISSIISLKWFYVLALNTESQSTSVYS